MSWNRFDTAARNLAKRIKKTGIKVSAVYGNPRGGLPLAVRLSHLLDVPLLMETWNADENCLYVDDIVDTGKTAECARTNWRVVALYWNPKAGWRPDFYVYLKPHDSWINFPWEKK